MSHLVQELPGALLEEREELTIVVSRFRDFKADDRYFPQFIFWKRLTCQVIGESCDEHRS